jgi:ankyrin repeat protein
MMTLSWVGYVEEIRRCAAWGKDLDCLDKYGYTPLDNAVYYHNNADIARVLVAMGANVNARNRHGETALHVAACFNNVKAICFLLDAGANIEAKDNRGRTPLLAAACSGQPEATEALLLRGASASSTDSDGMTARQLAVEYGMSRKDEVLKILSQAGN